MKRVIALLLALTMLLSLAACGGAEEETSAAETVPPVETATETTAVPATEPTLSPEEQLLISLPERMRQACELGIV